MLLPVDQQSSILGLLCSFRVDLAYAPYGHAPFTREARSLLGFNGQSRNTLTGLYLLGNGYRAYSPTLNRFYSSDSWSPFGDGGLNAYAYCGGNPLGRHDPSGHMWRSSRRVTSGAGRTTRTQSQRLNSTDSSRSSSLESLVSSAPSRSRSTSPVASNRHQSVSNHNNWTTEDPPIQRRDSNSSVGSVGSVGSTVSNASTPPNTARDISRSSAPLNFSYADTDSDGQAILRELAKNTNLSIDEEIYFRFNNPTTTLGFAIGLRSLARLHQRFTPEYVNMARINQLKRQS